MASTRRPLKAILSRQTQSSRTPAYLKDDVYKRHSQLLHAVSQATQPLERLLAATKMVLVLLTDILRGSSDPFAAPATVLGQHYMSSRVVDQDTTSAGLAGSSPLLEGTRVYVQEMCTFDVLDGPKRHTVAGADQQGAAAVLNLRLKPVVTAKSKRLGRENTLKVNFEGACSLQLLQLDETYTFTLPSLQLLDPLSKQCPAAFKGELAMYCRQTGLSQVLQFTKDGKVSGTIEQRDGPQLKPVTMGEVSGYWVSQVTVRCPGLGKEGTLYDAASLQPAAIPLICLQQLGPRQLPRLWSAIHDAVLYADPRLAVGGRAAVKLVSSLASSLRPLELGSESEKSVASGLTAAAAAGARGPASTTGLASAAGTDPEIDQFDLEAAGWSLGDQDTRPVPPCYKAAHAAGRRLEYQLQYTLGTALAAEGSSA